MKIALNCHFGGFALDSYVMRLLDLPWNDGYLYPEDLGLPEDADTLALRSHPRLIAAIEEVTPERAHRDWHAGDSIRIVEVPDDAVVVYLTDYDGREGVTWSMSEIHHA